VPDFLPQGPAAFEQPQIEFEEGAEAALRGVDPDPPPAVLDFAGCPRPPRLVREKRFSVWMPRRRPRQQKRLPVVKLGLARQASAVVPESALIKFLKAEREPGKKTDSKAEGRAA
jgi:hypothetical protein